MRFDAPETFDCSSLVAYACAQAGLPLDKISTGVISIERQVRIAAGTMVFTGVMLGTFVHGGFYGLSGFVGAGLIFAKDGRVSGPAK